MSLPRFGYCRRLYSGGPWENAGTHSSQIIQCTISCTGLFKNLSLIFPQCVLLAMVKNMKLHELTCFSVVFKSLLHLKPGIQQYPLIILLVQIESYLICHRSYYTIDFFIISILIFSKKSILPSSHHRGTCMCFTSFAFLVFMVRKREAGWEEMRKLGLWRRYLSSRADDVNAFGYFSFPPYCHVRGDDVFVCEDVTNWIVSLHWTDKQFAKVVRTHT